MWAVSKVFIKFVTALLPFSLKCFGYFLVLKHVGSQFPDQRSNPHPHSIKRQSPTHWTAREIPLFPLKIVLSEYWSWKSHPFARLSAGNSIQCKESARQGTFWGPLVCGWPCRPRSSGSCPLDTAEGGLLWGPPTLPPIAQLFCRSCSELAPCPRPGPGV